MLYAKYFKMKSIKLSLITTNLMAVIKRFPAPILIAVMATSNGLISTFDEGRNFLGIDFMVKFTLLCLLAFPTFFSAKIFSENTENTKHKNIFYVLSFIFLGWFYLHLGKDISQKDTILIIVLCIGLHMLVAVVAHISNKKDVGFWQYNKHLFLRFLTATLYSMVLYAGICFALLAIENLFSIRINEKNYARLFIFFAGTFHTTFFLSGIPKNIHSLNDDESYPKGLKIFTQYVLLPLVTLYLCILYVYMFKVIANYFTDKVVAKLWTSWLVLSFSIVGVLALLLLHPLRNNEEHKWINIFSKRFYVALLPLSVFQLWSIAIRTNAYGITINRYFIVVLSLWLLAMSIYFLLSIEKNIRTIPLTLFIIAFASIYSPISAFIISENSQVNILENIFRKYKLIDDGKKDIDASKFTRQDAEQAKSIITYLDNFHNLRVLQPWFKTNLDSLFTAKLKANKYEQSDDNVLKLMNSNNYYATAAMDDYFSLSAKKDLLLNTDGFEHIIVVNENFFLGNSETIFEKSFIIDDSVYFKVEPDNEFLFFYKNNTQLVKIELAKHLAQILKVVNETESQEMQIANEKMVYNIENDKIKCRIIYKQINGNVINNEPKINSLKFSFLFTLQ